MCLLPLILFVLHPMLAVMSQPLVESLIHSLSAHSITTLCISTVILKMFLSVHCVVANVGTVLVVGCRGPSDQSPKLRVLISADSLACNKCYLFCQRLLQQCDEDLHLPESIVHALGNKVDELQDRSRQAF